MADITKIKLPSGVTYDLVDKTSGYITSSSLPTKTSDLTNDGDGTSAFATIADIGSLGGGTITGVKTTAGAHTTIDVSSGNASFNVPTKTSHLTNDAGYLTAIPGQYIYSRNFDTTNQHWWEFETGDGDTTGTVPLLDSSDNLVIDGSLTTGGQITTDGQIKSGGRIILPNNNGLRWLASDGTTELNQMYFSSADRLVIGNSSYITAINGSNFSVNNSGNITASGGITPNNHSSSIGTVETGTLNSTTSVSTTVVTLGSITLPAGHWIIQAYVQFPGGTAGYRRAFITDNSSGTATGAYGVSAGYAPANTIVTQDPVYITPTLTSSTTYYLRASASVELTVSYRAMKAIRIE